MTISPSVKTVQSNKRRQKSSDASDVMAYITDPVELRRLRDMTRELYAFEGCDFRWIARHSWRGEGKHGYYQQIARGGACMTRPQIRPRVLDLITIRSLLSIRRECDVSAMSRRMVGELDEYLLKRAEADHILVGLILCAERNAKRRSG